MLLPFSCMHNLHLWSGNSLLDTVGGGRLPYHCSLCAHGVLEKIQAILVCAGLQSSAKLD